MKNIIRLVETSSVLALVMGGVVAASPAYSETGSSLAAYGDKPITPFRGAVDPFRGAVDPFRGEVNPFYGDLDVLRGAVDPFRGWVDPFAGEVDASRGAVDPFRGWVDPFGGDVNASRGAVDPFRGAVDPFYREIDVFWREAGAYWRDVEALWEAGASGEEIALSLTKLIDFSGHTWSDQIGKTGEDYTEVAHTVLSRYSIDLANPSSLGSVTEAQRARFMLDFYDTLMRRSGRNNADYWMNVVDWSPMLTAIQESGGTPTIGLLDATVAGDPDLVGRFGYEGGYDAAVGGHGASVASLMVGAHDGSGVMGIAPSATVVAFNPFDETNSAGWEDIAAGIGELVGRKASVINMSLGIPGAVLHQDWAEAFEDIRVQAGVSDTVFVIAAGNDGIAQESNVDWSDLKHIPELILVGSVGPSGEISKFSNRPGDACIVVSGKNCKGGSSKHGTALMDRFLVAPGEMVLMSDGSGSLTRQSGTSFAAPIVSGAVALLHSRWPWLAQHPEETADIILSTATDLGEKGTDEVYGRGLLNIRASQSPIDISRLGLLNPSPSGKIDIVPLRKKVTDGLQASWAEDGILHLFETVGETYRDFLVPLSDAFYGNTAYNSETGTQTYLQDYFSGQFEDWWGEGRTDETGKGHKDSKDKKDPKGKKHGFTDIRSFALEAEAFQIEVLGTPMSRLAETRNNTLPAHNEIVVSGLTSGLSIGAGQGLGAMALMGSSGFARTSDYRGSDNAVNPVLGFASGGRFASAAYEVNPFIAISGGISNTRVVHANLPGISAAQEQSYRVLTPYTAAAAAVSMQIRPSSVINLGITYSRLDEDTALLGIQSTQDGYLDGGAETHGLTLMADADLGAGFSLALAATGARTDTNSAEDRVKTGSGGLRSTAFAVSTAKTGLMAAGDRLTMSLKQPLYLEAGSLVLEQMAVINRETGELGEVRTSLSKGQERPFIAELIYGGRLASGVVNAFARADVSRGDQSGVLGGVSYRIAW